MDDQERKRGFSWIEFIIWTVFTLIMIWSMFQEKKPPEKSSYILALESVGKQLENINSHLINLTPVIVNDLPKESGDTKAVKKIPKGSRDRKEKERKRKNSLFTF